MRIKILLIFLVFFGCLKSQNDFQIKLNCAEQSAILLQKKIKPNWIVKDSLEAKKSIQFFLQKAQELGYVAASVDSVCWKNKSAEVYFFVGEKFENIQIRNGNLDEEWLQQTNVKSDLFKNQELPISALEILKNKFLQSAENKGYPFAEIKFDSFQTVKGKTEAYLFGDRHDFITYDSLQILGTSKLKNIFLRNYLGIKMGKPYNESNLKKITNRIAALPFVESTQKNSVRFVHDKAMVSLFLKNKKTSQFDLLIGVLPGASGQKVLITGQAKIHLISPFGFGEELLIQWQKIQAKTQTLNVFVAYPYFVGLPLGLSVKFDLYKKDTTYLDLDRDFGVQYQLVGSNYLKASLRQKTTIVSNIDTNYILATHSLPPNLDINTNEFAAEFFYQKLNYKLNPLSGYLLKMVGTIGSKKIKQNTAISGLINPSDGRSFAYLYDTLKKNIFQFRVEVTAEKYWKIHKRMTIKTALEAKYFYSQKILNNEKYRIGGMINLRGFTDQSIFTPYYVFANLEYRYLLSKNSYFYGFFNAAMVQETGNFKYKKVDLPYGFGLGAAFETKIGIFGLSYAMGTQQNNPITLKSAKIHFGYVNYF